MRMSEAWRLLRVKDGVPHTLFHGFHGTRALAQDSALHAVERTVWNPGKRAPGRPGFLSGWHVLSNERECRDYLTRFKAKSDIVVCRVWVSGTRPKPRARSNVLLARYMKIDSLDWGAALATM